MSYKCTRNNLCDGQYTTNSCPRVQRFSNTQFLYRDNVIGNEKNDCSRHINDVAVAISNYY